jgi:hypothetical protein
MVASNSAAAPRSAAFFVRNADGSGGFKDEMACVTQPGVSAGGGGEGGGEGSVTQPGVCAMGGWRGGRGRKRHRVLDWWRVYGIWVHRAPAASSGGSVPVALWLRLAPRSPRVGAPQKCGFLCEEC